EGISVVTSQHAGTSNYRTLDELHERLDPTVFWRVHRSHLVNVNKIKEIVPWFRRNYILRMKDEKTTEIPVSRTQTRRLGEYLKLYATAGRTVTRSSVHSSRPKANMAPTGLRSTLRWTIPQAIARLNAECSTPTRHRPWRTRELESSSQAIRSWRFRRR